VTTEFDASLLILSGCLVLLLLLWAGFLLLRRRAGGGRESAARDLCAMLDGYLDIMTAEQASRFDTERLWTQLERARLIHREHFPELYAEMLELAKVHSELTTALLDVHMRRHGAPTAWNEEQAQARLEDLQQQAAAAVLLLKRRCRSLAHLYAEARER